MTPAEQIAEHLRDCAKAQAAIVVDGSADLIIAELLIAGWRWASRPPERIGGKRIRYLEPPEPIRQENPGAST